MKALLANLKRLIHEYVGDVIIALSVVLVVLMAGRAYKKWSSLSDITQLKTTVELASVALGIVLGAVAAIAGYRRFFKGRTFPERIKLEVSSHPICELILAPDSQQGEEKEGLNVLLHVVDVSIENIGSSTLWTPEVDVCARRLESGEQFPTFGEADRIEGPISTLSIPGIEPGEVVYYHYRFVVPKGVAAFRIGAEVRTSRKNVWHRAMTLPNVLSNNF